MLNNELLHAHQLLRPSHCMHLRAFWLCLSAPVSSVMGMSGCMFSAWAKYSAATCCEADRHVLKRLGCMACADEAPRRYKFDGKRWTLLADAAAARPAETAAPTQPKPAAQVRRPQLLLRCMQIALQPACLSALLTSLLRRMRKALLQ
jgi:hypothetical protein